MSDFKKALEKARNIMCTDREGSFTCHTVDPYLDELERAHNQEMQQIKDWVSWIDTDLVKKPWSSLGKGLYTGDDMGSIVAEVDGPADVARIAASCVNQIVSLQAHFGLRKDTE